MVQKEVYGKLKISIYVKVAKNSGKIKKAINYNF